MIDLGFVLNAKFAASEEPWQQRHEELSKYVKEHGDTNVPRGCIANRQLGTWLARQRNQLRDGKIQEQRRNRLIDLGFVLKLDLPRRNHFGSSGMRS